MAVRTFAIGRAARMLAILALAVFLGSCDDSDKEPPALEVHIGLIQSLSGAAASYGTSSHQGMVLAFNQIAEEADPDLKIRTSIIDDESSDVIATEVMQELLAEGVSAIIGPTLSGVAFAVHPLAQDAQVVVLSPTTTAAGITDSGDYIFSLALTEARVIPEVVRYVQAEHGVGRAVMFWDSTEAFSPFSSAAMRDGLAQAGGTMVAEIDLSEQEVEDGVASLEGLDFDLIFVSTLLDVSVDVLEAVREAGYEQIVIGGNGFNTPELSEQAGEAVEGAYVGAAWNPDVEFDASRAFVAAYQEEYDVTPDQFAAQGYTAVQVLVDAVRRANSAEPDAIREALSMTRDLETPLGILSFDDHRNGVHEPVIQQYRQGVLEVVSQ